jgi:hypothetical protein
VVVAVKNHLVTPDKIVHSADHLLLILLAAAVAEQTVFQVKTAAPVAVAAIFMDQVLQIKVIQVDLPQVNLLVAVVGVALAQQVAQALLDTVVLVY